MKDRYKSKWLFETSSSGLLIPKSVTTDGLIFQYPAIGSSLDTVPPRSVKSLWVMPSRSDLWSEEALPLDEILSSAPRDFWLLGLTQLAAALSDETFRPEDLDAMIRSAILSPRQEARLSKLESEKDGPERWKTLDSFPVLLTMELAAAISPTTVPDFTPTTLAGNRILEAVYLVSGQLSPSREDVDNSPAGTVAALFERSDLGTVHGNFVSAYGIWLWQHDYVDERISRLRSQFSKTLCSNYEIALDDWIRALFLVNFFLLARPKKAMLRECPVFTVPQRGLTEVGNRSIGKALSALAATVSQYASECRDLYKSRDLLKNPSLLPIKRHPCLHVTVDPDSFLLLSPVHVAEAAFERPVRLAESLSPEKSQETRGFFGELVEAYVHGILNYFFRDRYERPSCRGVADGIIWYPQGCIVVECKATRVPEMTRYSVRDDASYLKELERGSLAKAVKQISRTIESIRAGRIEDRTPDGCTIFASIIVFFQEIPPTALARSVLSKILPETRILGNSQVLRPQIMSLRAIEELDRWSSCDLLQTLQQKMRSEDTSLESLRNYLMFNGETPGRSGFMKYLVGELLDRSRSWYA